MQRAREYARHRRGYDANAPGSPHHMALVSPRRRKCRYQCSERAAQTMPRTHNHTVAYLAARRDSAMAASVRRASSPAIRAKIQPRRSHLATFLAAWPGSTCAPSPTRCHPRCQRPASTPRFSAVNHTHSCCYHVQEWRLRGCGHRLVRGYVCSATCVTANVLRASRPPPRGRSRPPRARSSACYARPPRGGTTFCVSFETRGWRDFFETARRPI